MYYVHAAKPYYYLFTLHDIKRLI